jgi:hypothetical protein
MTSKNAVEKIKRLLGLTTQNFFEAKTEQGMAMKMEGELEVGQPIYISTEEGLIPAPPGVHKLDDGSEIEVDDDGMVSKIKMGDMEKKTEDEKIEDEKEMETIVDSNMSAVEMEFGDVKLVDGTVIRMEGEGEIVGRRIAKVGYDGSLSAIADGEYETEGGKVLQIVGGAIQGVQSKADNKKRGEGFGENPETFTIAKTAQGATVESKTFDVGEEVMVIGEDGSKKPAPDGEHQVVLKDTSGNENKIRFVTKDGKITERENVEEMENQMMEIAELFSQALKKIENKLDEISKKNEVLESKFNKFSKEPAGSRVYTQKTINEEDNPLMTKLEAFRRMREDMSKN